VEAADSRPRTKVSRGSDKSGRGSSKAATPHPPRQPLQPLPPSPPLPLSRRRGLTLESAIYDAVLTQLNAVGFSAMTMEGIAASARTGKAALYRRWPSKEDLVADTLNFVLPPASPPPDTGSVRGDIAEVFRRTAETMGSPAGCAMQALFGELDPKHEFIEVVKARVLAPRKASMIEVLKRGVERGDVRPEALNPVIAEAGPALLVHRLLSNGPPIEEAFIDAVLDEVVMPLIRPMTAAATVGRKGGPARS
jgi:AcrR family transcriptional regulator